MTGMNFEQIIPELESILSEQHSEQLYQTWNSCARGLRNEIGEGERDLRPAGYRGGVKK